MNGDDKPNIKKPRKLSDMPFIQEAKSPISKNVNSLFEMGHREQYYQSLATRATSSEDRQRYEAMADEAEQHRLSIASRSFPLSVNTMMGYKQVRSRIQDISTMPETMMSARELGSRYSESELRNMLEREQQRSLRTSQRVGGYSKSVIGTDESGFRSVDEGMIEKLDREMNRAFGGESRVAMLETALKEQRKSGRDISGTISTSESALKRTASFIGQEGLRQDVAGGKYSSLSDETKKLTDLFTQLSKATEKYKEDVKNSSESVKDSERAVQDFSDKLTKQQSIVNEMRRQGSGFGDDRFRTAAGILGATTSTAERVGLYNEIEATRMKTAFAMQGVAKYERVSAAIGGDAAAMMMEMHGTGEAERYANKMGNIAAGTAVSKFGALGANTVAAYKNLKSGNVSGAAGNVGAVVGGVGDIISNADRMMRGTLTGEWELAGYQAKMEQIQALNAIPAKFKQRYIDQYMGGNQATIGLGVGSLGQLTDLNNVQQFAAAGLTQEQTLNLASLATPRIGKAEGVNTVITRAGQAQLDKLMTGQQYVQNVGQLVDVGGRSNDLEKIMSNAIAAGMDNSKNIKQMVDSTAALAQDSATRYGVSTVNENREALSGSIQKLRDAGIDPNLATNTARSMLDRIAAGSRSTAATAGGMIQFAALRREGGELFAGPTGTALMNTLQGMSYTDIQKVRNEISSAQSTGNRDNLDKVLSQYNLRSFKGAPLDKLSNLMTTGYEQSVLKAVNDIAPNGILLSRQNDMLSLLRGEPVSDQAKDIIGSFVGGNPEILNALGLGARSGVRKTATGGEQAVNAMRKSKAKQELSEFTEGGKDVNGNFSGDKLIQDISKVTEYMATKITDVKSETQRASLDFEPIKGSFENFGEDTKRFGKSVEMFSKAIEHMNKIADKANVSMPTPVLNNAPYQQQMQDFGIRAGTMINKLFNSNDNKDSKR